MGAQGWLTSNLATLTKTLQVGSLEMRLIKLSSEKNIKAAEGSAKTAIVSGEMNAKLEATRAKLGENPSSEEYRQNMAECESIENEYQIILQQIADQMKQAEDVIQTQIEGMEVRLEALREELEQCKENANEKAENSGYFNQ